MGTVGSALLPPAWHAGTLVSLASSRRSPGTRAALTSPVPSALGAGAQVGAGCSWAVLRPSALEGGAGGGAVLALLLLVALCSSLLAALAPPP